MGVVCLKDLRVSLSTMPCVMGTMYGGPRIDVLVEVNAIENARAFVPEAL